MNDKLEAFYVVYRTVLTILLCLIVYAIIIW